ncbi:MAG TPA: carbohydrate kinase family protein [Melioribacteraceae bacterium]|nr:carbohydrate kinase family protein [Melioribacteraceae bacterium]
MKLLLIGSSVLDYIHEGDNCFNKPGGVFYSALGTSSIVPKIFEVFLLTNYTESYFPLVKDIYKSFNLSYITITNEIPIIHLIINRDKERDECYQNLSKSLVIPSAINYNQFDGILLNMITGFDITFETLEDIRKNYNGIIYCDIHSLARGINNQNKRYFRKIPNIKRWLNNLDIIQVNESELLTLSKYDEKELIVKDVFETGIKGLIITKSEKGVEAFYKTGNNLQQTILPANKVKSVNSVGCGDVFGSIFFYTYIWKKDFEFSLNIANFYAGIFSTHNNYNNFIINLNKNYE